MESELVDIVQRMGRVRALVVGDVMLDRYVWGDAERISQEAPVVLLRADRREERLGGAGSVAIMLGALGARVEIAATVGPDADGDRVRGLLSGSQIGCDWLITDADRATTVKERYLGGSQGRPQQMLRVDYESRQNLRDALAAKMAEAAAALVAGSDMVFISDYGKGFCTRALLAEILTTAKRQGVKVVVDPTRCGDWSKYSGAAAIVPNRCEAAGALGEHAILSVEHGIAAARYLQRSLGLEAAVVKLDCDGIVMAHQDGRQLHFPARVRQVCDITGAGDMVLAVLGMALAAGADYDPAIRLANTAAGLEVEQVGVAAVTKAGLLGELLHSRRRKVLSRGELLAEVGKQRSLGRRIAFANGCFDILHAGHVQCLQEARGQADCLVVGLNSDASVRRLKGPDRPINSQWDRAALLADLQSVDFVTVFEDDTPRELVESIRPDVLVKGADYRKEGIPEAALVESYGGRVHLATLLAGRSTTGLVGRIRGERS